MSSWVTSCQSLTPSSSPTWAFTSSSPLRVSMRRSLFAGDLEHYLAGGSALVDQTHRVHAPLEREPRADHRTDGAVGDHTVERPADLAVELGLAHHVAAPPA